MNDELNLAREWVEVREESKDGQIVLRPVTYDVPPARGRRRLDLREQGQAASRSPGPDDRLQSKAGSWSRDGDTLTVDAGGWSGTYRIEQLTDVLLILVPVD